jgi:hypothetical protein
MEVSCDDNIKTDLKGIQWEFGLGQGAVPGSDEHGNEASVELRSGNFFTMLATVTFLRS